MRGPIAFLALVSLATAPLAPVTAEDTTDIYSKDGIAGPSFSRSTQCAAVYVLTMQMLGSAQQGYQNALKQGTAWLAWAGVVSEGQDAAAEMNRRKDAFTAATSSMNNDQYNEAIGAELKTCLTIKSMFDGMEPFSGNFAQAVAEAGNSEEAQTPDVYAAIDCVAIYSVVKEVIGKKDKNYKFYNKGIDIWAEYAVDVHGGSEDEVVELSTQRATLLSNELVELLNRDPEGGLQRIATDRDTCLSLEAKLPKYFKDRKGPV